jgi:DNA invertase Pin-like site-specific DNA recombinase
LHASGLVEQVDRLSRLSDADWRKLRADLEARQIRVVALDFPTSWQLAAPGDEFTARMFAALNAMMLDMLAAVARKDYEDRRRRQAQGIVKAKAAGAYRGRPEDTDRNAGIAGMLRSGMSWTAIQAATGCSRATIARFALGPRSGYTAPPYTASCQLVGPGVAIPTHRGGCAAFERIRPPNWRAEPSPARV